MIVTLTANPAIDRSITLTGPLERGAVQRTIDTRDQAGGKGINVARALIASGLDAVAVFPAAANDPFTRALQAEGLPHAAVPIRGRVRTNIAAVEPDGTTTQFNEAGPHLSLAEREHLIDAVVEACRDASWLVLAGSLPPADPPLGYARVIKAVRARLGDGAPRIAVDSSGAPLHDVLVAGGLVDLITPNAHELAELIGPARAGHRGDSPSLTPDAHPSATDATSNATNNAMAAALTGEHLEANRGAAAAAARAALALGCGGVLVTLGAAGAIYVDHHVELVADAPRIEVSSTVGAGDATLAGFLLAHLEGMPPAAALAQAVAHGAAAASLPGSSVPARHQTNAAAVHVSPLRASDITPESPRTEGPAQ